MTATASNPASETDMVSIIQAYNGVTERLKHSHDALMAEVVRLREELHEKNRELRRRERLASLGRMAAGVAHEIRNPLGGIGIYVSLLQRDLVDQPEQLEIARKMSVGIKNLDGIVRHILDFAGDAPPDARRVNAGGILDDVLVQAAPQADARSIVIEVDPALREVDLWCDGGQVEGALLNLVLNAIDAAEAGGRVWIKLDSGGEEQTGEARIAVEDDGAGLPADMVHRVFDPFFTTKDQGTGLGLAIVHRIAEANGGSVTASNRPEGGARFVLTVPLAGEREMVA